MTVVVATIESVSVKDTSRGSCWEAELSDGNSVASFDEEIGAALEELEGQPAKLDINIVKKGQYTNRYVNAVEETDEDTPAPAPEKKAAAKSGSSDNKDTQIARAVAVHTFGRITAGATPAVVGKHLESGILEKLTSYILTGAVGE